jgi:hypothetical protein
MNNEQLLAMCDELKNIRANIAHQLSRISAIERVVADIISPKEETKEEIKNEEPQN